MKPSMSGDTVYTVPTMEQIRRNSHTHDTVNDMILDVNGGPIFSNVKPAGMQPSHFGKPRLKQSAPPARAQQTSLRLAKPAEVLFKWVTAVDKYGQEYRKLVEAIPPPKPTPHPKSRVTVPDQPGWSFYEQTGRRYQSGHYFRS